MPGCKSLFMNALYMVGREEDVRNRTGCVRGEIKVTTWSRLGREQVF
jgi:hypothetical protein